MAKNRFEAGKSSPVTYLSGIGEKKAQALAKIGISTIWDVARHYPRAYENRGDVRNIADIENEAVCSLVLTVSGRPQTAMIRRGMTLTKFSAFDDTGSCKITYFNQPYIKDSIVQGGTYRFYGRVKRTGTGVSMASPIAEPAGDGARLLPLSPLYPLTAGISQKQMRTAVSGALALLLSPVVKDGIKETLPLELRRRHSLCDIGYALRGIHFPDSFKTLDIARRRLVFDDLYTFALLSRISGKRERRKADAPYKKADREKLLCLLPYSPTGAQLRTMDEIDSDLSGGFLMERLLTGDVGSGKTLCAAYALFCAAENGYQAALMAPTEILAVQHYSALAPLFEKLGYSVALLTGSLTKAAKNKIYDKLAVGSTDIVIGTHALIEDIVHFRRLGLAITDEQHRFGAGQRERLFSKGTSVHALSMSATPIPRTLAMVLYGDSDISTLDEMPPNRRKTDTFLVDSSYEERLYKFISKNIDAGGQVYIVCPAIEEEEKLEDENGEQISLDELFGSGESEKPMLRSAKEYYAELSEKIFPQYRVALMHGRMSGTEKDRIMRDFAAGKVQILVSTTVIEVGVNVPTATLMIVENAERFGLSQLHQLRGRVGRGAMQSYCVLVSDSRGEDARKRLEMLASTTDGYKIAEFDLETRGPGDFIESRSGKIRQSGELSLPYINMGDSAALYTAFDEADKTLAADPMLSSEANAALREKIEYIRNKNQLV